MSAFAGTGENVWTYVNLTHETVWFCASFVVRKSDSSQWPETMLLSKAEQVVHLYRNFGSLIEMTRLMLVSPGRMNNTGDWLMEPLGEIWRGQDPAHGGEIFVYTLLDGRQYVDSVHTVLRSDLLELECIVNLTEHAKSDLER
ncbi:MAG: hypothetical protein JNL16_14780 [Dechloromonas sp.]|nr:hypothetical protein [Dechloromonas sp.]